VEADKVDETDGTRRTADGEVAVAEKGVGAEKAAMERGWTYQSYEREEDDSQFLLC
jgi:hypothetical protein